ncbi:MAG: class I SAM-dependent methyltransferase [Anaerolineae bacterium]|nr:class I SAM-dependent methyltransferase [Anaerolineae bacterium]
MSNSVADFYDQLADDYHLIFGDWQQSVQRQGALLDGIIRREIGAPPLSVLDCTCGIGTQAIGLALHGYTVHATDLSAAAVKRAAREADGFGVSIRTGVADVRKLETQVEGTFDVVISMDNSLPHLLTDDDLAQAARGIATKTRPDGRLIVGMRDYDQALVDKPRSTPPQLVEDANGKHVTFQVWEWQGDEPFYTVNHFILKERDGQWQTAHRTTVYRALRRAELDAALTEAGFRDLQWWMPAESGAYQPILAARRG